MACALGHVLTFLDDVIITWWRHRVGLHWKIGHFCQLWSSTVLRCLVCLFWNFTQMMRHTITTFMENFNLILIKMCTWHVHKNLHVQKVNSFLQLWSNTLLRFIVCYFWNFACLLICNWTIACKNSSYFNIRCVCDARTKFCMCKNARILPNFEVL